jgi:DNA-binding transcriptional LysR family regulator
MQIADARCASVFSAQGGAMLSWEDFKLVKALAETRSLAGAADRLAVNSSTVFRRLRTLEAQLNARLFDRRRGGYQLTPTGEEMADLAARVAEEVAGFERRAAGRDLRPSGELRVTTNDSLLHYELTDIFARFCSAYPDIRLDIIVGNQSLNLSRRDADIAIRTTEQAPETLIGRRLAGIAWAIYGREDDEPADSIAALEHRRWVLPGQSLGSIEAARFVREIIQPTKIAYSLNTVLGLAEAIGRGVGIGPLPAYVGRRLGLRRIAECPEPARPAALWILTHADIRGSARVKAFMEFVGNELAKLRPSFEGAGN